MNEKATKMASFTPFSGMREQGRSQGGEGGKFAPPKPKKWLQKNGVISEGSIFSNKFQKKNKKNKNKK